jgi:hypothetical protein
VAVTKAKINASARSDFRQGKSQLRHRTRIYNTSDLRHWQGNGLSVRLRKYTSAQWHR